MGEQALALRAMRFSFAIALLFTGCQCDQTVTLIVEDSITDSIDEVVLETITAKAKSEEWYMVRVTELPTKQKNKKYLMISPVVKHPDEFGGDLTLVVMGGEVVEVYRGR